VKVACEGFYYNFMFNDDFRDIGAYSFLSKYQKREKIPPGVALLLFKMSILRGIVRLQFLLIDFI